MTGHTSGNKKGLVVIGLAVFVCLFASLISAEDKTLGSDQPPTGSNEILVLSFFRDNGQAGISFQQRQKSRPIAKSPSK